MSHYPGDQPSSWLDEALRDVPLPADLVARLRRLGVDDDGRLHESLREVLLPDGLAARLKRIPEDLELDRRVADLAVPTGLSRRLQEIPLNRAAAPLIAPSSVTADPQGMRRKGAPLPWAVAVSLAAVVGLVLLGTRGGVREGAVRPDRVSPMEVEVGHGLALSGSPPGIDWAIDTWLSVDPLDQVATPPDALEERSRPSPSELVAQTALVTGTGKGVLADPWLDANLLAVERLAMPDQREESLRIGMVGTSASAAWEPPTVKGFDLGLLLREGVNPFVAPAADPRLQWVHVPLTMDSSSYRDFRLLLAEGELIAPQEVATEDFLAAVEYDFPPPQEGQALALHASGGPSPWDAAGRKLLLVGVQARGHVDVDRPPVEITIVVDASSYSLGLDAFAVSRQALRGVVATLDADDRLSIILAAQQPIPLAQRLGAQDAETLLEAIDRIGSQQIVDVVPAIEAAVRQAGAPDDARQPRIVCLTSDLAHLSASERQKLSSLVAGAARRGLQLDVVRVAPITAVDEACVELARAGGGAVHAVQSGRELRAALYSLVTNASATVAENVSLAVRFDPQVVRRYRLLGHEGHAFYAAQGEQAMAVDLHIGDAAVAVFELELHSAIGPTAEVGSVHLTWRDHETHKSHELSQRVTSAQFATVLAEAVLPLERATIAVMAAEILRGTGYVPTDADLADVLAAADRVSGQLWEEAWFIELVEAIQSASRLSPSRARSVVPLLQSPR